MGCCKKESPCRLRFLDFLCAKITDRLKMKNSMTKLDRKSIFQRHQQTLKKKNSEQIVEQIIRPTGLLDPKVSVRPIDTQIQDLKQKFKNEPKKMKEF